MEKERRYLRLYFSLLFTGLSVLVSGSLLLNIRQENRTKLQYAEIEARSSYNKDLLYRQWSSGHGGVYVPITDSTKPNEYLSSLADRDIVTTTGKKLTLINPVYMTRQVLSIANGRPGVIGHVTSLKPLRPLNAPDEWEAGALKKFEKGLSEYSSIEKMPDGEYLRFMVPMKTDKNCLVCHAHQGYKVGDVRGGISVSVPIGKYNMIAAIRIKYLIITHIIIYLIILLFSIISYLRFSRAMERKYLMQANLEVARLRAEENDNLKTAFLQNMSHEIRTPMNAICGFSEILSKESLIPEKRDQYISIIRNSSMQLLSIVSDVLTMSSLDTNQEKVNVDEVCIIKLISELQAIFRQQSEENKIPLKIRLDLNDRESKVYTDQTKLTQIISNLLSNSLKFTREGYVEVGCSLRGTELEFYVKDTGPGIRAELHEKIFERFRQGDVSSNKLYSGTGLGLTISKSFAELLGGKIWVESEPGKGATFRFTIPYNPIHQPGSVPESHKINPDQSTVSLI